jgi:hypothetical protein
VLNRSIRKLCWRMLGVLLLIMVSSAPVLAAAEWTVVLARGTVFSLVDSKWEEVVTGQELSGEQVIRTLQSGRLRLEGPGGWIELGGGTAIQLQNLSVTQFSGSITVEAGPGGSLTVAANTIVATINGKATLRFDGADVSLKVAGGSVKVADAAGGKAVELVAGQSVDVSDAGIVAASAGGGSANAAGGNPNASPMAGSNGNAGGNGNSNAGGNGNGNAGGNGSAGGNENGNSGGNGNGGDGGNAGGGGDNDAGGNGNGNAGGNGNGNAGGNGNGNGSGN